MNELIAAAALPGLHPDVVAAAPSVIKSVTADYFHPVLTMHAGGADPERNTYSNMCLEAIMMTKYQEGKWCRDAATGGGPLLLLSPCDVQSIVSSSDHSN